MSESSDSKVTILVADNTEANRGWWDGSLADEMEALLLSAAKFV
jgi:hypothetical protein